MTVTPPLQERGREAIDGPAVEFLHIPDALLGAPGKEYHSECIPVRVVEGAWREPTRLTVV